MRYGRPRFGSSAWCAALVSAALWLGAIAAPAGAYERAWSTPERLPSSGGPLALGMSDRGDALLALLPQLDPTAADAPLATLALGVDGTVGSLQPAGRFDLGWPVEVAVAGTRESVVVGRDGGTWRYRFVAPDGTAGAAQPLPGDGGVREVQGRGAVVGADDRGDMLLTWLGTDGRVLVSWRPAGGSFGIPQALGGPTRHLDMAMDPSGHAVVAWQDRDAVLAARGTIAAGFDPPQVVIPGVDPALEDPPPSGQDPRRGVVLATAKLGWAMVTYQDPSGLHYALGPTGAPFGPVRSVALPQSWAGEVQPMVGPHGEVGFMQFTMLYPLEAALALPGEQPVVETVPQTSKTAFATFDYDALGDATGIVARGVGAPIGPAPVGDQSPVAALTHLPFAPAWCGPETIVGGQNLRWPVAAFDTRGGGLAVWDESTPGGSTGTQNGPLVVARYHPPAACPPPDQVGTALVPVDLGAVATAERSLRAVDVPLTCRGRRACTGTLALARTARRGASKTALGRVRFRIRPRRRGVVRVPLDRSGRTLVRSRRNALVVAAIGGRRQVRQPLVLRRRR